MTLVNDDILSQWNNAKKAGITRKQFAKQLGITYKALDNRLYKAKKKRKIAEDKINQSPTLFKYVDGNYMHLASKTSRIKSIDDLIKAAKVDLNEWQIDDRYEVGSWDMGRRAEQKHIYWEDGKIVEGESQDTGKLWVETMFRFRVVLVRKKPKAITPTLQPVRIKLPKKYVRPALDKPPVGKVLIVPDSQTGYRRIFETGELIPFHDRAAHDIIFQVADMDDFDAVTYLGDGLDYTEWSDKFIREPAFYATTQPAIIEYAWFLARMKKILPDATHDLILGNHEDRSKQQLINHLYAAYQLKPATELDLEEPLSISRLLGLEELGIGVTVDYPNGEVWHGPHVRCVHTDGLSSAPGGTAQKMIRDITETTLAGHNHRLESAMKTIDDFHGTRFVTAATCGCLCHLDYRVPGHKKGQHWQNGFAVVYYGTESPRVELYLISDGETIYNGKLIKGKDYRETLSSETGWKF